MKIKEKNPEEKLMDAETSAFSDPTVPWPQ